MQGRKDFTDKVVTRFRLSERVPAHTLYRQLAERVDWSFLYQQTRTLYSHPGQPSLDPVVFFKLVLVGRLENLVSDRRLVEHCALRLDILLFLGYEVDSSYETHFSPTERNYALAGQCPDSGPLRDDCPGKEYLVHGHGQHQEG
jgi:transposase